MLNNFFNTLRLISKQYRQQKLVQRDPDRQSYQNQINRLQREKDMFFRLWQNTEAFQESEFCILKLWTKEVARQALIDAWWFQQDRTRNLIFTT